MHHSSPPHLFSTIPAPLPTPYHIAFHFDGPSENSYSRLRYSRCVPNTCSRFLWIVHSNLPPGDPFQKFCICTKLTSVKIGFFPTYAPMYIVYMSSGHKDFKVWWFAVCAARGGGCWKGKFRVKSSPKCGYAASTSAGGGYYYHRCHSHLEPQFDEYTT